MKTILEVTKEDGSRVRLAEYYMAMGRKNDAQGLMESVAKGTGEGASMAKVRLAAYAVMDKRRNDAYKLIDEALQKFPKNHLAMSAKAELLLQDRKLDDALATAKAAVAAAQPPAATAHIVLGRIHAARMEYSDAVAAFNEAIRLNPRMLQAHIQLARIYFLMGRIDDSLAASQEALKLQPNLPDAQLLVARAYLAKGDAAAAEKSLKLLSASNPKSAAIQAQLGYLEMLRKNPAAARVAFDRALQLDPSQADAIQALNTMDIRAGNKAAARDRVERRVKAEPKNAGMRMLAGQTYIALGDLPSAERALRDAIDLDSANLMAYSLLGQIYASQRRLNEARIEFEVVAKRVPKAAGPPTMVGMIHEIPEQQGGGEALVREGAAGGFGCAGRGEQPGMAHRRTGGQSRRGAAARTGREVAPAEQPRSRRHVGLGLLQERPEHSRDRLIPVEHRKRSEESVVSLSSWPRVREERRQGQGTRFAQAGALAESEVRRSSGGAEDARLVVR